MPGKIVIILVSLSLSCAVVSASETSAQDDVLDCAALADDKARLTCFDQVADSRAPAAAEEPPSPPVEPVVAREPEPEAAPAPAPESEPAPTATAVEATAPAADPVAQFGMNPELEAKQADGDKTEELKEISALVVEVSKRARGEHVVTLDNGQVWTEKDAEPYLRIEVGDSIKIKRNRMGGYRIIGRGNRASAVVRIE